MAISGVVVKIKSEAAENVQRELGKMTGVDIETTSPQGDLIVVVEADNIDNLHKICMKIEKLNGVLGVYPSYVTTADEESQS